MLSLSTPQAKQPNKAKTPISRSGSSANTCPQYLQCQRCDTVPVCKSCKVSLACDGYSWGAVCGCDAGFVAISGVKNVVLVCCGYLSVSLWQIFLAKIKKLVC